LNGIPEKTERIKTSTELHSLSAQYAFGDQDRVIAEDVSHSRAEKRYYCFGKVADGILPVRFTYRKGVIRIIGAGYWRKGKKIYEKENKIHG